MYCQWSHNKIKNMSYLKELFNSIGLFIIINYWVGDYKNINLSALNKINNISLNIYIKQNDMGTRKSTNPKS